MLQSKVMRLRAKSLCFFVLSACLCLTAACAHKPPPARTYNGQRALLEAALKHDPSIEPRLIFLLLGQYNATGQQAAGLRFMEARLAQPGLGPTMRALYLSVSAALRVQVAGQIPLLKRIAWVERGIGELNKAVAMTDSKLFIVRWLRAIVFAQLPERFDVAALARKELRWAEAHADEAPAPGLTREVAFQQAKLARKAGDAVAAKRYLKKSGYQSFERTVAIDSTFALSAETGFAFVEPSITELIPGRVYQASGFEFTEYYFVVSEGGQELILIDAGARDDSAKAALAALRARFPKLPPVRRVLITHAHWDHVGGQRYLRSLPGKPSFYASANYAAQLEEQEGTGGPYRYWWGTRFDLSAVTSFRPDETLAEAQRLDFDGTQVRAIPTPGGETQDAVLFYFEKEGVLFTGDIIMPYLGAPFSEEGSARGLVETLEFMQALAPKQVLHGHAGINRLFPTQKSLYGLIAPLRWLSSRVTQLLAEGETRAGIHHRNLVPMTQLAATPESIVPYLVVREHLINRVVDQKVGYWQVDFGGSDTLTEKELGSVLVHYAKLDLDEQCALVAQMLEAGDLTLALKVVRWLRPHHPQNSELKSLERKAHLRLMAKSQVLDAFKFIWHGQAAGFEVAPAR